MTPLYQDKRLAIEPFGVDSVPMVERHGSPRSQFTLWLGSNLTIADFALGFFPVSLGLSWYWSVAALLIGNALGALVVALCAAMGPQAGQPQMMISRHWFGKTAGMLPAFLNYLSTIGWFSVNNILGAYGLRLLAPGLAFWQAALLLVVIQGLLAVFGHNLIHLYERVMSIVLALVFAAVSVLLLTRTATPAAFHPVHTALWVPVALVVAAAFSYLGSWAPYASDYSRYLPPSTSPRRIGRAAFGGGFLASLWLELVGVGVARAAGASTNPIAGLAHVTTILGPVAVIAIILGGTAADALNLYSNALNAGALHIRLPRWVLAIIASLIGLGLSLLGSGSFEQYYNNFLLLLGYWLTPWLGVMLVGWYTQRHQPLRVAPDIAWPALASFLIGLAASVPFMSSALYTGPIARALHGADLTFYVGFVVAAGCYRILSHSRPSPNA